MPVAVLRVILRAMTAGMLLVLLGACGDDSQSAASPRPHAGRSAMGHVHGLGTDPADGTLYAATHFGVFELGQAGAGPARRVAGRWQDTMGFTVVGPGHFLASGHPDKRENLPVHLGLIESTDAARTWEPVSLLGEADFHALDVAGDRVYGYDSMKGAVLVTDDRTDWRTLSRVPVTDLAADPSDPTRVLAATAEGLIAYRADAGAEASLGGAPPLLLLDWPADDLLVGMAGDGRVHRSGDRGDTWQSLNGPPGEPQALHIAPDGWYIATTGGLYRSADDGRTWQRLSVG